MQYWWSDPLARGERISAGQSECRLTRGKIEIPVKLRCTTQSSCGSPNGRCCSPAIIAASRWTTCAQRRRPCTAVSRPPARSTTSSVASKVSPEADIAALPSNESVLPSSGERSVVCGFRQLNSRRFDVNSIPAGSSCARMLACWAFRLRNAIRRLSALD